MVLETWWTDLSADDLRAIAHNMGVTDKVTLVSYRPVVTTAVQRALDARETLHRLNAI